MALTSNVPNPEFVLTGVVIPTESEILDGVLEDFNQAFGGGLNKALETPQGQLASSFTAVINDKNTQLVELVNNVDPLTAYGQWQDAIARIYFITRIPAQATVVQCTLIGVQGTVIPAGTTARDTSGNTYVSLSEVTIPATGNVSAQFQNAQTGPIACPANSLTIITNPIPGWDAITNPADGTLGRDVESRSDFEYRRKNSVAINGRGSVQAVYANMFDINGVLDCYVIDNKKKTIVNKGSTNYPMEPNSLYVAVVGGTDEDVAKGIWLAADMGCDYNGNTTVTVTDDSGYSYPYPSYEIKFQRPASLPIKFAVDIVDNPDLPNDIEDQIKAAIIARFNGSDGSQRQRIGAAIFASNYYGPIAILSPSLSLLSVEIGTVTANQTQILVGIDQNPTITEADITVTLS